MVEPRSVVRQTHKKFWFKCEDCGHDILKRLAGVIRGEWCTYCVNKRLCDVTDCRHCLERSFASHQRAVNWHPTKNNSVEPRNVSLYSDKTFWFQCDKCPHAFSTVVKNVSKGHWCPHCVNKTEAKFYAWCLAQSQIKKVQAQAKYKWCRGNTHYWQSKKTGNICKRCFHLPFELEITDGDTVVR